MNKSILKLAIPNIVSNITIPLLGLVDLILMGRLDSIAYIGAIGLGGTIFSVVYSIFSFMRAGTTGFTAQAYGAKDDKAISYSFYRASLIAVLASILVLSLQTPIEWLSLRLLNGSDEVLQYTAVYFRYRIWAAPAVMFLYVFNGWFIGLQNTTIPMFIAIFINVVNILVSILFVVVLHMNVEGVAIGTVISQYCGLLAAVIFFTTKYKRYIIPVNRKILLEISALKRFFKVNTDFMIRSILLVLTIAFFLNQSAKFGDELLAVNMILMQFFYIFSYFVDGFAYAGEALVGKYTGARDALNLKKVVRHLLLWGLGLSLPFTLLYWAFPETFIRLIADNPSIVTGARPFYFYMIIIPVITFAAFLWDGIYIGATASKHIRNTMILSSVFVFLPAWYVLTRYFGNHGLWIAFLLFMLSRGISMTVMSRKAIFSWTAHQD